VVGRRRRRRSERGRRRWWSGRRHKNIRRRATVVMGWLSAGDLRWWRWRPHHHWQWRRRLRCGRWRGGGLQRRHRRVIQVADRRQSLLTLEVRNEAASLRPQKPVLGHNGSEDLRQRLLSPGDGRRRALRGDRGPRMCPAPAPSIAAPSPTVSVIARPVMSPAPRLTVTPVCSPPDGHCDVPSLGVPPPVAR